MSSVLGIRVPNDEWTQPPPGLPPKWKGPVRVFEDDTESFIPDDRRDGLLFVRVRNRMASRSRFGHWLGIDTRYEGSGVRKDAASIGPRSSDVCCGLCAGPSRPLLYQRSQLATLQIRGRMGRGVSRQEIRMNSPYGLEMVETV